MRELCSAPLSPEPFVLLESFDPARGGRSLLFERPLEQVRADRPEEVGPAIERVEAALQRGLHAAGFIAYEAAGALDPALRTRPPTSLPLLWFGLFPHRKEIKPGLLGGEGTCRLSDWEPSIRRGRYQQAFDEIQRRIIAGETYQVNYTFRLRACWEGEAFALYRRLCRAQRASYCAYVQWGSHRLLSVSPELFFELSQGVLKSRPMKGTCARGRWSEEDEHRVRQLQNSAKDRAENLMIVDLLRNDLGRISVPGSVEVAKLFEIERYDTVLQMTSTITSRLAQGVTWRELFAALFPCGSVTGAPKVRTMEIIAQLEESPRGVYTGCIGYLSPGPEAAFNVAIRTLWLDQDTGIAEFGVGGGITHDSTWEGEYEECLLKAEFLGEDRPTFELLETLLWERGQYFLLARHLKRLESSARYFGYPYPGERILEVLRQEAAPPGTSPARVRLLLSPEGAVRCERSPLGAKEPKRPFTVTLAREPIDSRDVFLFHKTTHRAVYESRLRAHPEVDDVILHNERGELTESTIGNLAVVLDGIWWTPPVACGLLPGVYRAELLQRGQLRERILYPEDLARADRVYLLNSVRRAWPAQLGCTKD